MEYAPYRHSGSRQHLTAAQSRKRRANIIKGGKLADEIKAMADDHHEQHEMPSAEKKIDAELEKLNSVSPASPQK